MSTNSIVNTLNNSNSILTQLNTWEAGISSGGLTEQDKIDILPRLRSLHIELYKMTENLQHTAQIDPLPALQEIKVIQTVWARVFQHCADTQIHAINQRLPELLTSLKPDDQNSLALLQKVNTQLFSLLVDIRLRPDQKETIVALRKLVKEALATLEKPYEKEEEAENVTGFEIFSAEIMNEIFSYLSIEDFGAVSCSNTSLHAYLNNPYIQHLFQNYPKDETNIQEFGEILRLQRNLYTYSAVPYEPRRDILGHLSIQCSNENITVQGENDLIIYYPNNYFDIKDGGYKDGLYNHTNCYKLTDELLILARAKTFHVFNLKTQQWFQTEELHEAEISHIEIWDGKIVTVDKNTVVKIWDLDSFECIETHPPITNAPEEYSSVVQYHNFIIYGTQKSIVAYDLDSMSTKVLEDKPHYVRPSLIICGSDLIAVKLTNENDVIATVYDLQTGKAIRCISDNYRYAIDIRRVQTTEDKIIISVSHGLDKKYDIYIYNKNNQNEAPIVLKNDSEVTCLKVNGRLLFSAHADTTIKIWDLKTCTCISSLVGHAWTISRLVIVDGQLISISDSQILIWNLKAPDYRALLVIAENLDHGPNCEGGRFNSLTQHLRDQIMAEIAHIKEPTDKNKAKAIYRYLLRKALRYLKLGKYEKAFAILDALPSYITDNYHVGIPKAKTIPELISVIEQYLNPTNEN